MTLKESFKDITDDAITHNQQYDSFVQITDEFAIGFAEWIRKEVYYEHLTKEFIYKRNLYESEKELLEVFKKEKGI
jgi:hypothetical protein